MAKTKSLLEEAVVAAKEVREAAIQHAYKELEENLTPSIKEALAQKLEEEIELDDENLDEAKSSMSGFTPVKEKKAPIKEEDEPEEEEETEEKVDVEDEEGDETEEVKVDAEEEETEEEPEESDEMPESEEEETEEEKTEEPSDDTELKDLTLGDLKELIASMVSVIAPEKPAEQPEDMVAADVQGKGEEEVPITGDEEVELDIADDETKPEEKEEEGEDVEIDLTELLKELETEEHDRKVVTHKEDAEFQKELDEVKAERDEALRVVNELKQTLEETNLLNARLSCMSQLLSKPLTEGQKVRAIRSLDEAQSPKEAKAIFKTLAECFDNEAKASKKTGSTLREHKGIASRAAGKSTAAPIVEVDPTVRRFQQLAGIIK